MLQRCWGGGAHELSNHSRLDSIDEDVQLHLLLAALEVASCPTTQHGPNILHTTSSSFLGRLKTPAVYRGMYTRYLPTVLSLR